MGSGNYTRAVGRTTTSGSSVDHANRQKYYTDTAKQSINRTSLHNEVDPGRIITCTNQTAIGIIIDGTGSMGQDAFTIYDKMPMFYGQLLIQGYVPDPAISFAVVGDVNCDDAPIQVCDFAQGDALDEWLKKLYLEGGGGGQNMESYELMAFYYNKCCELKGVQNSFIFFIGDEGFYPKVKSDQILDVLDIKSESVSSEEIFKELNQKFHVFRIHKQYRGLSNKQIMEQWQGVLKPGHLLTLVDPETKKEDPKAIIDIILGAIAMIAGTRDLDGYAKDLAGRDQTTERIRTVRHSLSGVSNALVRRSTVTGALTTSSKAARRDGTKRL